MQLLNSNKSELIMIDVFSGVVEAPWSEAIAKEQEEDILRQLSNYFLQEPIHHFKPSVLSCQAVTFVLRGFVRGMFETFKRLTIEEINRTSYVSMMVNVTSDSEKEQAYGIQKVLQHRVSNNFQSILGIFTIQGYFIDDEEIKKVLDNIILEIKRLIEVHKNLYEGYLNK